MRPHPIRSIHCICALLYLWSGLALAETTLDPFGTEAALPLKPALRLGGAVGDPCAETMSAGALNRVPGQKPFGLLEVVNLALCNNPQTREVWASARVQAAQVGVSKASYLPGASLSVSGNRNSPGVESARQLLAAASATQDSTVQTAFLQPVQSFYQTQATQAALDAALESEHAAKESFAAAEAHTAFVGLPWREFIGTQPRVFVRINSHLSNHPATYFWTSASRQTPTVLPSS